MDQIRIGAFLKALRKEKGLTQEQLAEKLAVSGRTVSRWETGSNMPDIGMLVVLADFYGVSIPELINGERKSENMNQETRDTAIAMAEYSQVTAKSSRRKVIGILFITFGLFIIISALSIFPSESSWGGIYATLGSIILIAGIYLIIRQLVAKRAVRLSLVFGYKGGDKQHKHHEPIKDACQGVIVFVGTHHDNKAHAEGTAYPHNLFTRTT